MIDKTKLLIKKITANEFQIMNYANLRGIFGKSMPELTIDATIYCGEHTCLFCKKDVGCKDIIIRTADGVKFIFPEGYVHYLEVHGVQPSETVEKIIIGIDIDKDCIFPDVDYNLLSTLNVIKTMNSSLGTAHYQ